MSGFRDRLDAFENARRNFLTDEAGNAVACIRPIQPGKGEAAAMADAQGKESVARAHPIKRNRPVRVDGEIGKGNMVGERPQETLRQHNRIKVDRGSTTPVPIVFFTLGCQRP